MYLSVAGSAWKEGVSWEAWPGWLEGEETEACLGVVMEVGLTYKALDKHRISWLMKREEEQWSSFNPG